MNEFRNVHEERRSFVYEGQRYLIERYALDSFGAKWVPNPSLFELGRDLIVTFKLTNHPEPLVYHAGRGHHGFAFAGHGLSVLKELIGVVRGHGGALPRDIWDRMEHNYRELKDYSQQGYYLLSSLQCGFPIRLTKNDLH